MGSLETHAERGILARRASPPLDPTRGLEPRDSGDEVRAREPERRREGFAGLVVRRLLRHRRMTERAPNDDTPKRARRSAQLALDSGAVTFHRRQGYAPSSRRRSP